MYTHEWRRLDLSCFYLCGKRTWSFFPYTGPSQHNWFYMDSIYKKNCGSEPMKPGTTTLVGGALSSNYNINNKTWTARSENAHTTIAMDFTIWRRAISLYRNTYTQLRHLCRRLREQVLTRAKRNSTPHPKTKSKFQTTLSERSSRNIQYSP